MIPFRTSLLAVAVASTLSLAGAVSSRSFAAPSPPTAEQQKQIDAARADLERAARRLADLTGRHGGQGFHFERPVPAAPVVGVVLAPDPQGGVRVAGVTPDGAAAGAGLRAGDRLVRIGGKAIGGASPEARVDAARELLRAADEKTALTLAYARDGREREVSVTPRLDSRIMIFAGDGHVMRPGGEVVVRRVGDRADRIDVETLAGGGAVALGDAPRVRVISGGPDGHPHAGRHVIRIECKGDDADCRKRAESRIGPPLPGHGGPEAIRAVSLFRFDCKPGEACGSGQQRLAEAFRWNGLNLASVDAQLGRYFGTDKGVLVLSPGPALGQLQAGDVIRRVDGKAVDTPRAMMDALRDKPADSTVAVEYLRDRASATTRLKVPKAMALPLAPPAPPAPPRPPVAGAPPHAPGTAMSMHREMVIVDEDGQVRTWEDDGEDGAPMPPTPPAPPVPPRVD